MNRDHLPPSPDDALLQRYQEANALDPAGPDPALRERVLAHARLATEARAESPAHAPRHTPAANDSQWAWRALGGLAVVGLVSLVSLQFDRGTPEEQETALERSVSRPSPPARMEAPAAAPTPAPSRTTSASVVQEAETRPSLSVEPPPMARAERTAGAPAMAQAPAADLSASPAAPAVSSDAAQASAIAPAPALSKNTVGGSERARRGFGTANQTPALSVATATGDLETVRRLLAEHADPNARDPQGRTPLMTAAQNGNEAMVRALLAAGADRGLRDPRGLTAAHHAERSGHVNLLPLLR